MERKLLDTKYQFILYGVINILLMLILLLLLILIFNDIYILDRIGFVLFVGVHLFLLFFVKIHYLCIFYNDEKQIIEIHYNRRFGIKWKQRSRTVLLPLKRFNGYNLEKDSLGLFKISFYKLEQEGKYELGPFHMVFLTAKERKNLEDAFGESL